MGDTPWVFEQHIIWVAGFSTFIHCTLLSLKINSFYDLNKSIKINKFLPRDATLARYMLCGSWAIRAKRSCCCPTLWLSSIHCPHTKWQNIHLLSVHYMKKKQCYFSLCSCCYSLFIHSFLIFVCIVFVNFVWSLRLTVIINPFLSYLILSYHYTTDLEQWDRKHYTEVPPYKVPHGANASPPPPRSAILLSSNGASPKYPRHVAQTSVAQVVCRRNVRIHLK